MLRIFIYYCNLLPSTVKHATYIGVTTPCCWASVSGESPVTIIAWKLKIAWLAHLLENQNFSEAMKTFSCAKYLQHRNTSNLDMQNSNILTPFGSIWNLLFTFLISKHHESTLWPDSLRAPMTKAESFRTRHSKAMKPAKIRSFSASHTSATDLQLQRAIGFGWVEWRSWALQGLIAFLDAFRHSSPAPSLYFSNVPPLSRAVPLGSFCLLGWLKWHLFSCHLFLASRWKATICKGQHLEGQCRAPLPNPAQTPGLMNPPKQIDEEKRSSTSGSCGSFATTCHET